MLAAAVRLLTRLGHPLQGAATVLDFGCGAGELVGACLDLGYDAYGCDFRSEVATETDRIRAILDPYRLPFADNTFDFVCSNAVFEHVQDYGQALAELRRVLRAGGVSYHVFPSRYMVIEPHVFVPFATIIQSKWWLSLWARLGIRNQFQDGKTSGEVTELNARYLRNHTTYLPRGQLLREVRKSSRTPASSSATS